MILTPIPANTNAAPGRRLPVNSSCRKYPGGRPKDGGQRPRHPAIARPTKGVRL